MELDDFGEDVFAPPSAVVLNRAAAEYTKSGTGGRKTSGGGGRRRPTTPPQSYICRRCNAPGHWIQQCPTNRNPVYDHKMKKMKLLTLIPNDTIKLPTALEDFSSTTRVAATLPPELHCPLCQQVMKYAVFTSKCCFTSFCDTCIRTYILSNTRKCVCGATNVLADDLLPNKTVREIINHLLLESDTTSKCSSNNVVSSSVTNVHDAESANCAAAPKRTTSPASKAQQLLSTHQVHETANAEITPQTSDKGTMCTKAVELSGAKLPTGKPTKKKATKDITVSAPQEFPTENYAMPFPYPSYNPYWGGMQSAGMPDYMPPFTAAMPYMMGYAPTCSYDDVPFGGRPAYSTHIAPPQRGESAFGKGFNPTPSPNKDESQALDASSASKEEFEIQKASILNRSKQEGVRQTADRESRRELGNNADIGPPKEVVEPIKKGKNRVEDIKEVAEHKSNVFSRLSFPEDRSSTKRKLCDDYHYKEPTISYAHHRPLSKVDPPVSISAIKEENNRASSGVGWKGLIMKEDSSDGRV